MPEPTAVICRTKNRPVFLRRALRSIAAQTTNDYHVYVINDGGVANRTAHVGAESPLPPERVTICDHADSHGRAQALIDGIHATDSPYIAVHDDDDTWDPGFLATTMAYLDSHEDAQAAFVPTDIVYEHVEGDRIVEDSRQRVWPEITQISLSRLAEENQAVPISGLYRRASLEAVGGFNPNLPVVEDWELHLRLSLAGPLGWIDTPSPLAHWHQRPAADGDEGNSTLAMSASHAHYDQYVRDENLRTWVNTPDANNLGLLVYLGARFGEERRRSEGLASRLDALENRVDQLNQAFEQANDSFTRMEDSVTRVEEPLTRIDESLNLVRALDRRADRLRALRARLRTNRRH